MNSVFEDCKALTFDLFGTVLDLGGSLTPHLKIFLDTRGSDIDPAAMWQQLRYRQRIEQYQDTLVELGHSGYLETVQKAFVYVARANKLDPTPDQVDRFMAGWQELSPFPECVAALDRLGERYKLVALSNGNPWFLDHLVKNRIKYDFDGVISVEEAGYFKPKPGVYRRAARILGMEPGVL
ncbi:MAG: HAD-IA family hydrolase, partial [Dehalococcoidia bacterium]